MFVVRFEESAVPTDRRRPAQRQVETRTTASRVLGHLAVKNNRRLDVEIATTTLSRTFEKAEVNFPREAEGVLRATRRSE